MAETIRVVEGLDDHTEVVIPEDECEVCKDDRADLTQYYPRLGRGGEDMGMATSALGNIFPLTPDLAGVVKTSVVSGLSIQINGRLADYLQKSLLQGRNLGPMGDAAFEAGLAVVSGGLIAKFTKKKAMGTAWALGPMTVAVGHFVASLLGPGGAVTGLNYLNQMPQNLPPGVAVPRSGNPRIRAFDQRVAAGM